MNATTSSSVGTAEDTPLLPTTWDEERDVPFFRLVADVLPPETTYAAGVLLASYDLD